MAQNGGPYRLPTQTPVEITLLHLETNPPAKAFDIQTLKNLNDETLDDELKEVDLNYAKLYALITAAMKSLVKLDNKSDQISDPVGTMTDDQKKTLLHQSSTVIGEMRVLLEEAGKDVEFGWEENY